MELKFHYRIHKSPSLVPILSQIIPIYAPSYILKINFNVIFPSVIGFSKCPLTLRFPQQNRACMSSLPYAHHIHQPFQYSWFSVGAETLNPSYILKINFNIIFPSVIGSSKCPLTLRFPQQNRACMSSLPYAHHIHQTSQYSWFSVGVETMNIFHPPFTSPFKAQIPFPATCPQKPHPKCDTTSFTHTLTHKTGKITVRITILLTGNKHTHLFLPVQFTHKMY